MFNCIRCTAETDCYICDDCLAEAEEETLEPEYDGEFDDELPQEFRSLTSQQD